MNLIVEPDWTPEEEEAMAKVGAAFATTLPRTAGRKFDAGKLDYTLVPFDAMDEIVKVLMFGAQKYERENWRHVDNATQRYTAAAFRHLTAYTKGEENDPETGISHLAHAGCCILFLLGMEKPNGDDT